MSLSNIFKTGMSSKTKLPLSINAVMFDQLKKLVPDFSRLYESGDLKCSKCAQPLSENGIYSVERRANKLLWCCQSLDCISLNDGEAFKEISRQ